MVHESPKLPIIVPIWHIGFEDVLPNEPPYNKLKMGNRVTINFGNPIDLSDTLAVIKNTKADDVEARRLITEKIQEELEVSHLYDDARFSPGQRLNYVSFSFCHIGFATTNRTAA
jgi:1-acyl-sn-glycerol-3-phosphate acyltransferase